MIAQARFELDRKIQAHRSVLVTGARWRRRGIERLLLCDTLVRAGGARIDLLGCASDYYLALGAEPRSGSRLPQETSAFAY